MFCVPNLIMDIPTRPTKRLRVGAKDPDSVDTTEPFVHRRRHVKYQRHGKPPYTYLAMMVVAIETSPDKQLPLADIQKTIGKMFPFFEGEYQGWKDSVRHNLSHNSCFVKTSRTSANKTYLWAVDLSLVPRDSFKRIKSQKTDDSHWAPTLTQHLRIPDIELPAQRNSPRKKVRSKKRLRSDEADDSCSLTPHAKSSARSLVYTDAQYTRYLREQTPAGNVLPLNNYPAFATLLYDNTSDVSSAATNLCLLCPTPDYGTPVHEEVTRQNDLDLPIPKVDFDALIEEPSCHFDESSSSQKQHVRVQIEAPPSLEFAAPVAQLAPADHEHCTHVKIEDTELFESNSSTGQALCVTSDEQPTQVPDQQTFLSQSLFLPEISFCSSSQRFEPISPAGAYRYVHVVPHFFTSNFVSELSES